MEAQVLEEGCINGIRGTGGGVYQWKNMSGRRGVSIEEQVWKEGVSIEEQGWEEDCWGVKISQVVIRG